MTTSPVMSVTDELVAELEKEARLCDSDTSIFMEPAVVAALLAERAELKRDAERWRYARDLMHPDDIRDFQEARDSIGLPATENISAQCDAAIDAAMQS